MNGFLRSSADVVQGLIGVFKILYGAFFDCAKEIFEVIDRGKKIGKALSKQQKKLQLCVLKRYGPSYLMQPGGYYCLLLLAITISCLYMFSSTHVSQHVYRSKVMFVYTNQQQMLYCIKRVYRCQIPNYTMPLFGKFMNVEKTLDSFTGLGCVVVKRVMIISMIAILTLLFFLCNS